MSSIAGNQGRTFFQLFGELRLFFRNDRNLPARIQQRLASERRFGSRDRRLYRELLYTAVRHLPWIEERERVSPAAAIEAAVWLASPIPALQPLKAELDARFGTIPRTIAEKAAVLGVTAELLPSWTVEQCALARVSPNLEVLHSRAPLWLRLQTNTPAAVLQELEHRGWKWQASPMLPTAIEVLGDVDITTTDAYKNGLIEIQDVASQLLLHAVGLGTGTRWLDACAGAGGKTLQLARLIGPSGHVVAHDIRPSALVELSQRAQRAGLRNVSVGNDLSGQTFDGVFVDAPCTGTGTWRRSPHLKWCTSAEDISAAARLQKGFLTQFARNLRPGGLLVYATCSLCREENDEVAEGFLRDHPDYSVAGFTAIFGGLPSAAGLTFWPAVHNSDGFFVAAFRRG